MRAERQTRSPSGEETDRESGRPGGGQGRRDEVGRTGVYPMSAPEHPGGEAELRGQAEWSQGERGAAGYEDHGDSEASTIPPEPGSRDRDRR